LSEAAELLFEQGLGLGPLRAGDFPILGPVPALQFRQLRPREVHLGFVGLDLGLLRIADQFKERLARLDAIAALDVHFADCAGQLAVDLDRPAGRFGHARRTEYDVGVIARPDRGWFARSVRIRRCAAGELGVSQPAQGGQDRQDGQDTFHATAPYNLIITPKGQGCHRRR
jgi:hypothetical protein